MYGHTKVKQLDKTNDSVYKLLCVQELNVDQFIIRMQLF